MPTDLYEHSAPDFARTRGAPHGHATMNSSNPVNLRGLEDKTFLLLVAFVSLAFIWILWPFFGAVLWGIILAIVFTPMYRRLWRSMGGRRTVAALTAVLLVFLIVILPVTLVALLLLQEGFTIYEKIQSGDLNPVGYFQQVFGALPSWVTDLLDRLGLSNLSLIQERLSTGLMKGGQLLASHVLSIGQNTFDFVVNLFIVLYLVFFLLRDGHELSRRIGAAVPLGGEQQRELRTKFAGVIRATIKGTLVVAIAQGALGGLIFWYLGVYAPILWAVVMAFLSLLPAVGTALVWIPVAIYFLVTGAVWSGVILIAYGVIVIGLVDNLLRPILVGKETKIPDYVILMATLGGMAIFGINGFVIGPVIAAMFIAVWDIVTSSRDKVANEGSDA